MLAESGLADPTNPSQLSEAQPQRNRAEEAQSMETTRPLAAAPLPEGAAAQEEIARLRDENRSLRDRLAEAERTAQTLSALCAAGEIKNAPGPERAAHAACRALARVLDCALACVYETRPGDASLRLLASAGPLEGLAPASIAQNATEGPVSQAIRTGRVVSSHDLPQPAPLVLGGGPPLEAILAAPMVSAGSLRGLILLAHHEPAAFFPGDSAAAEAAAAQLLNAWQHAEKASALTGFVQAVSKLSAVQEVPALLDLTASIARETLNASFVLAGVLNQQEWITRSVGDAPRLRQSLSGEGLSFLESAAQAQYTFRLRDLRQDERAAWLPIDTPTLCSILASPIRTASGSSGVLLAFGKKDTGGFADTDVFLAERLAAQTAINLESCFLNHELRSSLKTTQLLYDLSLSISLAENLNDASRAIARTACRLLEARKCGLVLYSVDGRIEAEVCFPSGEEAPPRPHGLIQQAMDARQTIILAHESGQAQIAMPIQTKRRCYGALWLETTDQMEEGRHPTEEIRILVNQAAVALERSILLEETRFQAAEIANSYRRLETAYEDLLYGLTRALDARDGETERHSARVEDLALRLGLELGLNRPELQALKRGALLHDIGKIGIPDSILRKPGPLDEAEWVEMRTHPQKGAQIVQEIPALQDALPVIAFHQERWDGSGYPLGLRESEIPLVARIFAVVDVYDALTSDRPYRKALSIEEAAIYLEAQAGRHFDPEIVRRFIQMIRQGQRPPAQQP